MRVRQVLNWVNGMTLLGLIIALVGGTALRRSVGGVWVAGGYRFPVPRQRAFTVGNVVLTRSSAEWLLAAEQAALLRHECRHSTQYAIFGPLFFPAYGLACGWSWVVCGSYGSYNVFERWAGLAAGGYPELPPRWRRS